MKNMFDPANVAEIQQRLGTLTPESKAQWGKMHVGQAMAHCSVGFESANGDKPIPRLFIGRLLGGIIKPFAVRDDAPMKKNSPTAPAFLMGPDCQFTPERAKLAGLIDRFAKEGASGCTTHPHAFFGKMTPDEWAILMYKHMDHHLRQFGA